MPPPIMDKVLQRLKFPTAIDPLPGRGCPWLLSYVLDEWRQFLACPVRHNGDPLSYISCAVAIAPLSVAGLGVGPWGVLNTHRWSRSVRDLLQTKMINIFISCGNADRVQSFLFKFWRTTRFFRPNSLDARAQVGRANGGQPGTWRSHLREHSNRIRTLLKSSHAHQGY